MVGMSTNARAPARSAGSRPASTSARSHAMGTPSRRAAVGKGVSRLSGASMVPPMRMIAARAYRGANMVHPSVICRLSVGYAWAARRAAEPSGK